MSAATCIPNGHLIELRTNSKATLRFSMDKLKGYSPRILHERFQRSRHYVKNSDSLQIRCQESRSGPKNKRTCWNNLYKTLREIGEEFLRNENANAAKGYFTANR